MEQPPDDLRSRAKVLLESPDLASMENLISFISLTQEQQKTLCRNCIQERLDAKTLFRHCTQKYPNSVSLKLSHFIKSSSLPILTRTYCSTILYSHLFEPEHPWRSLSPMILTEIKPILLSCLQEESFEFPNFTILSRIVCLIASQVFALKKGNREWIELLDYIDSTIDLDFRECLLVFRDLPLNIGEELLTPYVDRIHLLILRYLDSRYDDIWILAFGAAVSLVLQLIGSAQEDLIENLLNRIMISVTEMVNDGKHVFLKKVLKDLAFLVKKEGKRYSLQEFQFVSELVGRITEVDGIVEETRSAILRVSRILGTLTVLY